MSKEQAQEARSSIISDSKQYIGTPYRLGGMTKDGMDCSGLIYTVVLESIQYELPRNSSAMYAAVKIISDLEKEPGDLLFFRTTGAGISHVGIYLGNNQFIHAASDGPNTGVIISSLHESYWKNVYEGIVGRFLPAINNDTDVVASVESDETVHNQKDSTQHSDSTIKKNIPTFIKKLSTDVTGTMLWNLSSPNQFKFNVRGGSILFHIKYTDWAMQPGIALGANIEPLMEFTQIPLLLTISLPYGFRVYFGPVFTIGHPKQLGTQERIYPSIFPGIIGASWQTKTLKIGLVEAGFVQDIYFSVFNDENNAALPPLEAFSAGFVFSTGIRIILPFSNIKDFQ